MERFVLGNRIPLRFLIWILASGVLSLLLLNQVSPKLTSLNRTVSGLNPNTLYLLARSSDYCPADMVVFRSFSRGKHDLRPVTALGGSTFALTPMGYRIDANEHEMPESWRKAAATRLSASHMRMLEPEDVLIVNQDFGRPFGPDSNDWPFEIVDRLAIRSKVTTVLFAENIRDIGQTVGSGRSCHRTTLSGRRLLPSSPVVEEQQESRSEPPAIPSRSMAAEHQPKTSPETNLTAGLRPSID